MKVKSESRSVMSNSSRPHGLQPTVHGVFQARVLEWVAIAFSSTEITLLRFVKYGMSLLARLKLGVGLFFCPDKKTWFLVNVMTYRG